jgi:hypothetical protein
MGIGRQLALLVVLLMSGCSRQADLQTVAQLQRIQQAFDQAKTAPDFLIVAGRYQEVLDAGFVSGAVLFNQGNAFMRAEQRGRALACYRQAQRYLPRNPYLAANLRNAESGTRPLPKPLLERLLFWQDWISYPEKLQVMLAASAVSMALGIVALLFPSGRYWKRLAVMFLIVAVLFLVSGSYDWYRFTSIERGVVVKKEVVARKGNAENYEPAFSQPLSEGDEFTVRDARGDWLLVRLSDRQEGWVPKAAVVTY